MKAFYQMSYENVIKQFNSQINGLLNEEVYKQRENYGSNQLEEIMTRTGFDGHHKHQVK